VSARAELIADGGEAAVSPEFFRSRPFLDAEAATHTLRIETEGGDLVAPLLVRPIGEGPELDAISPYGYPGLVPVDRVRPSARIASEKANAPLDPADVDFSATGLVSAFVRHTLGEPPLAGTTERNVVQIADPALPPKSRPSDRRQVRKNRDAGYRVQPVPGAETTAEQRAGFLAAYTQTMARAAAAERYLFDAAYFGRLLEADRTWLALAEAPSGDVAAASLVAISDGFLHYYLSGTADSYLRDSPMKNVVTALSQLAVELALPLNLGGGISPGDPLEEFKRGFANREQAWHTSEIVCDREAYDRLAAGRAIAGFFPAYRAP
jgi:hypothetical protein